VDLGIPATPPSVILGMVPYGLRKEMLMSARIRQFVLGSAIVITLTVPVTAGMQSDAELLAQMQQEMQKLQEQLETTDTQCQAGQRQACEQGSPRREQLARMQLLIKECQKDDRESCTQLRSLRRR
jgi:TolA-binding protein